LVGALAGDLDADHGVASVHDRNRRFPGRHQPKLARSPEPNAPDDPHRDTAYLREALVDLQIAAIGRKEGKTDRRGIVDQLQGWLLWERHAKKW